MNLGKRILIEDKGGYGLTLKSGKFASIGLGGGVGGVGVVTEGVTRKTRWLQKQPWQIQLRDAV